MNWVSISNVKLDVLGLRCASVVDDVCDQIGINKENIDLNDPFIYQQLQDLKTLMDYSRLKQTQTTRSAKK